MPPSPTSLSTATLVTTLLTRLVVPLWVLAGAVFKLYERDPGNLPGGIRETAKSMGLENLNLLLRALIGCELFAAAVMIVLARFARPMAVFMLSSFCAILIWEMIRDASKCGCFGSLPFKPWHMLLIDGTLLLAVLVGWLRQSAKEARVDASSSSKGLRRSVAIAAVHAVLAMVTSFAIPAPPTTKQQIATTAPSTPQITPNGPTTTPQSTTIPAPLPPTVNPQPRDLPRSWYSETMSTWTGKPWREVDLFQFMPTWPKDMDRGKRYIIFYRRTCDHCQTMMEEDLLMPLDGPVTLVEVPESPTLMVSDGAPPLPFTVADLEKLQLPLSTNWLIETPLVIAVTDGKVTCAQEGEHKKCLGLQ